MKHVRIVVALGILTGCAGLIGVPDLDFDDKATQGTPDGSTTATSGGPGGSSGGNPTGDGGPGGGGDAAPTCDTSKIQTDTANCGRCGHDCVGGACTTGVCQAVALTTIANAPLSKVVEYGNSLYVSTITSLTTQSGGIWKVPKTSGAAVKYVDMQNAQDMAIVGTTLYFGVYDDPVKGGTPATGGLYSCDLTGPVPCAPTLITPSANTGALSANGDGKVYYTDDRDDGGIIQLTPPSVRAVFRTHFGFVPKLWVGGTDAFYMVTLFEVDPQYTVLFEAYPDAGVLEIDRYTKANEASDGLVVGTDTALYFTAWDYDTSTGGVVHRRSRPNTAGVAPCDYGKDTNKRPYGIYLDSTNVYWTNQGDPTSYSDGSLDYCSATGCCDVPNVLWTGTGEPDSVTGDATALYWVTYRTGEIWKIAKP